MYEFVKIKEKVKHTSAYLKKCERNWGEERGKNIKFFLYILNKIILSTLLLLYKIKIKHTLKKTDKIFFKDTEESKDIFVFVCTFRIKITLHLIKILLNVHHILQHSFFKIF